jgi:anti-anti-sigma factor
MKLKIRDAGKVRVVELRGSMTIGVGDDNLMEAVERLLDEGRERIVIHLKHVPYVDSAGANMLIHCTKTAKEKGADIHLAEPSKKVEEILGKFPHNLKIFDSEVTAVGSF